MHNSLVSCTEPVWKANQTLASGHKTRFQVNNLWRNLGKGEEERYLSHQQPRKLCVAASVPLRQAPLWVRAFLRSTTSPNSTDFSFPLRPPPPPKPHLFPCAPEVRPEAKPHLIIQILEDAFAVIRKPGVDQVYINYTLFSS